MTPVKHCLHFVSGKCTATLCSRQNPTNPLVCKDNGLLVRDRLDERNAKAYTAPTDPERRPL